MATPLYNTDIIPLTSRPTLTVMDDGDYFAILDTSTSKISKILKTNIMTALKITYDNTSGLTADTVQAALDELVVNLGSIDDAVSLIAEVVDTNRLYSDSQYLTLKAKYDAQQIALNASKAELYTDDPILQYGAVEIIGDGYEANDTPIDVSANVVDGKLSMEQKGLTITNLVDGADIADSGTVSFNTVNGDKYFDTLNKAIITGDGTEMSATNSSGSTANMAIYHLNAIGLSTITDTDILTKLLPYVDGTKNVGKMGVKVVGKNLFDKYKSIVTQGRRSDIGVLQPISNVYSTQYIHIAPSTSYYLYGFGNIATITDVAGVSFYDKDKIYISGVSSGNNTKSFTTPNNAKYLIFNFIAGTIDSIQLNIGSSAIPYEPYQEQLTFLPSIGNSLPNGVADSIKTVADGWEHTKRVELAILDGSEAWGTLFQLPTGWYYASVVNWITDNNALYGTLTSTSARNDDGSFKVLIGAISSIEEPAIQVGDGGNTSLYLKIDKIKVDAMTGATTIDKWKAYLQAHPVSMYYQLATPVITHYDLPHPTSGKTIHRFAGEEKIALYGTGLTFSENVLSVLSAVKFVAGEMTNITDLATITGDTVTFSGVNATDVVYVKVEHDVDKPLGVLEHTPTVSNTASRLEELEGAFEIITDAGVQYIQFN